MRKSFFNLTKHERNLYMNFPNCPRLSAGVAILAISCLLFVTVGCGAPQTSVTTDLSLAIAGAESAVSTLSSLDPSLISPTMAANINSKLQAASTALTFATTELASSDTPAVMAADISKEFASVIASLKDPALTSGTPLAIITAIQLTVTLISNFLTTIEAPVAVARANPAVNAVSWKLSAGDLKALPGIHAKALTLEAMFNKAQ
jgi:hypothetical protein